MRECSAVLRGAAHIPERAMRAQGGNLRAGLSIALRIDERNRKDKIYLKGQLKRQASRVCLASCWPRQGPSGPRTHCTGPVRTCSRPLGVQWSSLAPEIVGDCRDLPVPPMKTTVSAECPTALYGQAVCPSRLSSHSRRDTSAYHRAQPAAPRPQRPREWSAEVRRTCAELADESE